MRVHRRVWRESPVSPPPAGSPGWKRIDGIPHLALADCRADLWETRGHTLTDEPAAVTCVNCLRRMRWAATEGEGQ